MTYSLVSDVRNEFKSVLDQGTVMTDNKIVEFQLQHFALINAYAGTRYTVPITGTTPVDQSDTISFTLASGAGEVKTVSVSAQGISKSYSYTTLGADTAEVQRDAILALINADKDRLIEVVASGTDDITASSRVYGFAYTLGVTGTGVSFANVTAAILGSPALRLLRKVETELTACKIAAILKTKVAEVLLPSGVRQEIKDGTCAKMAMQILKDIQDGKLLLEDATLISSGGGLESSAYAGTFEVGVKQW